MAGDLSKAIIVTASDSGYFQNLKGLLDSLDAHRPASANHFDLGIIDLGLSDDQIEMLRPRATQIIPGRWDVPFPAQASAPRWFQAQVSRPFLPEYFPGYELYIWLDSDTWLQDWRAIELLSSDFDNSPDDIAIVPEIHWAYPYSYGIGPYRELMHGHAKGSFGEQFAQFLDGRAVFNSGVFSMLASSSIWQRWRHHLQQGLQNQPNKWTEQTALNLAIYGAPTRTRVLPAWCNWICWHALPIIDPSRKCLCEPTRPYEKLSVIHLTSVNKPGLKLAKIGGGEIEAPLDYQGFQKQVT